MSSKRSFLKEIHARMGSLLGKHGFSLLEEKEEPEYFGNAFAKFGSPSILLRIAKDRGDILVNIAKNGSETERWHKLEDVLKICATGMEKRKLAEVSTITGALSKHLEAIEDRFNKFQIGATEESLELIEKEHLVGREELQELQNKGAMSVKEELNSGARGQNSGAGQLIPGSRKSGSPSPQEKRQKGRHGAHGGFLN
jgi:hypothetical protein